MTLEIAPAVPDDAEIILAFIRELAAWEKLEHEVVATARDIRRTIFEEKHASVLLAREDGVPAGFAVFVRNYSTFLARPGIHLEDLYVRPDFRGRGIGRALLGEIARIAWEAKFGRVEWFVIEGNATAIAFYEKIGARPIDAWTVWRITGDALEKLAREREL